MNAITLGNPNLFVKGIAEVQITDAKTGDIIGFDKVASDGAIESSVNMGEITGGIGNPLLITIPDTTRINGNLTSQAFSLQQRALASGGNITYDGIIPVVDTITAAGTSLTVREQPVRHYGQSGDDTKGWCYVREVGAETYQGTNYGVNLTTKVVDFVAVSGKTYEVFYFMQAGAAKLALNSNFVPSVATVQYKFPVYAKQNNSVANGTQIGILYFVVPRAQFTGNVGLAANQTTAATTDYSWSALADNDNKPSAASCGNNASPYAYYIYMPCNGIKESAVGLAVVGGAVSVTVAAGANHIAQIPVKYVMPDGDLGQPVYTDLTFTSDDAATATVNANGVVTGVKAGSTQIKIECVRTGLSTLTTYCNVVVS